MRGVGVPLRFDERHRRFDSEMILGPVLPSLVEQSVRILSLIRDESVLVLVTVDLNPAIRRNDRRPEIRHHSRVSRSMSVLPGDDEEEESGVDAPVIWELPLRELGPRGDVEPVFVQNLSRLLLRFRVDATPLVRREDAQRCRGDGGVDGEHLPGRDERIASEQRVVLRSSGEQVALGGLQSIEVTLQRSPDRIRVQSDRTPRYTMARPDERWKI